jgi:hypothetical protein
MWSLHRERKVYDHKGLSHYEYDFYAVYDSRADLEKDIQDYHECGLDGFIVGEVDA